MKNSFADKLRKDIQYLEGVYADIIFWTKKWKEEMKAMKKRKSIIYRSAKTGKAVTKAYAKAHPATTEREVYKRRRIKRRKRRQ